MPTDIIKAQFWFMEAVLPKIMNKVTKTFSKILEKYVRMNSFLELAILLK